MDNLLKEKKSINIGKTCLNTSVICFSFNNCFNTIFQ